MQMDDPFDQILNDPMRAPKKQVVKPKSPYDITSSPFITYYSDLPSTLFSYIQTYGIVASNIDCNLGDDDAVVDQCVRQYAQEYEPKYQEMLSAIKKTVKGGVIYRGIKKTPDTFFQKIRHHWRVE